MFNLIIILLVVFITGCNQTPRERHYTQVNIEPAISLHEESALSWILPPGWEEEKAANQMRVATFRLSSDFNAFDCSIVSLPGGAGGLEANLRRWMGQIKLEVSEEQFNQFINASSGNVFDFTQLQDGRAPDTESMIAAMIELHDETVFVKLKGTIATVTANKKAFLELVASIKPK